MGWRHEGRNDSADWYTFRLPREVEYQVSLKNMASPHQEFVFIDKLQVFSARSTAPVATGQQKYIGATRTDSTAWFRAMPGENIFVKVIPARGVEYNGVRYELEVKVRVDRQEDVHSRDPAENP